MSFARIAMLAMLLGAAVGCRSAYMETTIENRTGQPLSLIEVDYPAASFGTGEIGPQQDFQYRFKVSGSGSTKILWTDEAHVEHHAAGPELQEGDEGKLLITFAGGEPTWRKELVHGGDR